MIDTLLKQAKLNPFAEEEETHPEQERSIIHHQGYALQELCDKWVEAKEGEEGSFFVGGGVAHGRLQVQGFWRQTPWT